MEKLDKLIEALTALVKSGSDVAVSQLPDVVNQVIAREVFSCWFWIGVCLAVTLGALYASRWLYKRESTPRDKYHTPDPAWYLIPLVAGLAFGAGLVHNIHDLAAIKVAPKVFAVDYLAGKIREIK